MKDYILQIKIKNAPFIRSMKCAGYETVAALSRACGVAQTQIGKYLNLQAAPIRRNGQFSESVFKISDTLKCLPEDLFPAQHLEKCLKHNTAEMEISSGDVAAIMDWGVSRSITHTQENELADMELNKTIGKLMLSLPARLERILRMRFGFDGEEKTLEDIAKEVGVNRERIRQLECKALRKLRHPPNLRKLVNAGAVPPARSRSYLPLDEMKF